MKLAKARVENYRSILDTGAFDVETLKTIMVGPNEAGKSAILQALQQTNPPEGISGFDSLRDYPRKLLNRIDRGEVDPKIFLSRPFGFHSMKIWKTFQRPFVSKACSIV